MSITLLQGDCRDVLRTLPDESVHCCVCSPPYWGLRSYIADGNALKKSELGLEPTYQEHVVNMVGVFREVKRVLRKDGTAWINYGDSFLNKQLVGMPWRVAFALQADGWYLRQDIIWSKPNPMPESVRDRCTKAHEYLFLLSKSERYFFDQEAIREKVGEETRRQKSFRGGCYTNNTAFNNSHDYSDHEPYSDDQPSLDGRNKRSVWEIATAPFPEAHFATFPPALIEPCILAGSSEKGCCAKCGAPWVRETEKHFEPTQNPDSLKSGTKGLYSSSGSTGWCVTPRGIVNSTTLGWSPSCSCWSGLQVIEDPIVIGTKPCTILDPFGGAGTTGLVADRLGRNAILIELNPEYATITERRIRDDAGMFAEIKTTWDEMWAKPFAETNPDYEGAP